MSKKLILLTLTLSHCWSGTLQAHPLDSPDIVYIDGLPCNSACQSYMAWSAQTSSARHRAQRGRNVVVPAEAETARVAHTGLPRVARQPASVSRIARRGVAASKTMPSNIKKTAAPSLEAARKNIPAATVAVAREKPVAGDSLPARKLEGTGPAPAQSTSIAASPPAEAPKSEVRLPPPATLEIATTPAAPEKASPAISVASVSAPRTIQQQVVEATEMADRVTSIDAAHQSDNPAAGADGASDTGKTASVSPSKEDNLVALVLARREISSLSDLNNKTIAIEAKQSASSGRVSAALMAVGAADVQFSEGQVGAIERLISGEVPAAVVSLISPEAAEWFPDIPGFRTFRVPLSPKAPG